MTVQPNVAVYFADEPAVTTLAPPEAQVTIDGLPGRRVRLESVEHRLGGAPRARFSVGLGAGAAGGDLRLESAAPDVRPGQTVRATLLRGGALPGADSEDLVLFEGVVSRIELALDSGDERLAFEAEDAAAPVLDARIGGQRVRAGDGSAVAAGGLPLVFNPDGRPNASAELYVPPEGEPYALFAPVSPAGAVAWTLAEAAAYLLAEYGDAERLPAPPPSELREVLPALVLNDVSLEGRTLGEALAALLEPVGGRISVAARPGTGGVSRRLEIWLPGRAPRIRLAHQAIGETFDPDATQFASLSARFEFAAAPRRYVARGDAKLYESTFDLVAGWDDALASYDPDDFSPTANDYFDGIRDVFRKWVLNEAGEYSAAPYDRGPPPDLSDVFEGEAYVRRHRRFLACLSRDALGRSRGVYAELSLDAGQSWAPLAAAARVLDGECGLYLTGDVLPPEYLRACMLGAARVRVTATIESDARVEADAGDSGAADLPGRTRHVAVPAGYRYRKVRPASRFFGEAADEADDTERLAALVQAAFEADRVTPAPARVEIPHVALGWSVGVRLEGTRGRRLDLAREHAGFRSDPVVRAVRFRFAPEPGTELELE